MWEALVFMGTSNQNLIGDSKNWMPKEFSNKFLKELNIVTAGVSLIEI
jgi:hypothetical protein